MQQYSAENGDRIAAAREEDGETRAFSKRLNAAKEKWRETYERELFGQLALTDPHTGTPVTTGEELLALLRETEAAAGATGTSAQKSGAGMPGAAEAEPAAAGRQALAQQEAGLAPAEQGGAPEQSGAPGDSELLRLRAELDGYRDREEDQRLQRDEKRGGEYRRLRPEVERLVDYARGQGRSISRSAAFGTLLLEHLDELLQEAGTRAGQEATAQMNANTQATPCSLGGGCAPVKADYNRMSDEEFGRVVQMALNGELMHS